MQLVVLLYLAHLFVRIERVIMVGQTVASTLALAIHSHVKVLYLAPVLVGEVNVA